MAQRSRLHRSTFSLTLFGGIAVIVGLLGLSFVFHDAASASSTAPVAPTQGATPIEATPVGGNSCSVPSTCSGGCSVSCTANKSAHCACIQRKVPCQGPYAPPECYDYRPSCTCQ